MLQPEDFRPANLGRGPVTLRRRAPGFCQRDNYLAVGIPREVELFFSRRIGVGAGGAQLPIEAGARLTGKVGENTNVGLIGMRTEGIDGILPGNDFSIARVSQNLPNRSKTGVPDPMTAIRLFGKGLLVFESPPPVHLHESRLLWPEDVNIDAGK